VPNDAAQKANSALGLKGLPRVLNPGEKVGPGVVEHSRIGGHQMLVPVQCRLVLQRPHLFKGTQAWNNFEFFLASIKKFRFFSFDFRQNSKFEHFPGN
jgi:hypothetical protein